ncbi:MAG TPA: hypothetical protein VIG24_10945 [Acidimicrobiia bacterium]
MLRRCVNLMCDERQAQDGLCAAHWMRLANSRDGEMVTTLKERCQAGVNTACVDCGSSPFGGGMRCLSCFQSLARQRAGEHTIAEPPSYGTYTMGCRCRDCKRASANYTRLRRQAA